MLFKLNWFLLRAGTKDRCRFCNYYYVNWLEQTADCLYQCDSQYNNKWSRFVFDPSQNAAVPNLNH